MTTARPQADIEHVPSLHDDLLQLAQLARVPQAQHKQFFDGVDWILAVVWTFDRRALGSSPSTALICAAKAARSLLQAFGKLDALDRECVDRIWGRIYRGNDWPEDVPQTIFQLAKIFSMAARMSAPRAPEIASPRHQKSERNRTRKNPIFFDLARWLKVLASDFGGKLGNDRLLTAIKILKPHLPDGVVPAQLTIRILKKVKPIVSITDDFYPYLEFHV